MIGKFSKALVPMLGMTLAFGLGGCSTSNTYNNYADLSQNEVEASSLNAGDVAAIDATIAGVYAVISGPVGQKRDFDAMRAMFTPDARLTAITPNGLRGGTLDDYITGSGAFLVSQGFRESGLKRRIEIYGDLAHVWSSYEGKFGTDQTIRGINSFQLVKQDGQWLVQAILWQAESPENPLPVDMQ